MVEPIASGEVFPNVVVAPPVAPAQTAEGHETCVYYGTPMECSHGEEAAGGFYSESFMRELKHQVHLMINFADEHIVFSIKQWSGRSRLESVYLENDRVLAFQNTLETLRELTK